MNPLKDINETLRSGGGSTAEVGKLGDINTALGKLETKLGNIETKLGNIETKLGNIDSHLNPLYTADYVAPAG